jgi:hypothetical protein
MASIKSAPTVAAFDSMFFFHAYNPIAPPTPPRATTDLKNT